MKSVANRSGRDRGSSPRGWTRGAAAAALVFAAACGGDGGSGSSEDGGSTSSVAEVVERAPDGVATRLGDVVTTEGVATVSAGIFSNNKLKIFIQAGDAGAMVYHEAAADVDAFERGDLVQVTGVVRQEDPVPDNNVARGTILVDITGGEWTVVNVDQPQPSPQVATLAGIGVADVGTVVRVRGLEKTEGDWPAAGSRSTEVRISDDGGATTFTLRLQRNTITEALASELEAIGDDGLFDLDAIVVQDDLDDDGSLLGGFELWIRGTGDIRVAG